MKVLDAFGKQSALFTPPIALNSYFSFKTLKHNDIFDVKTRLELIIEDVKTDGEVMLEIELTQKYANNKRLS